MKFVEGSEFIVQKKTVAATKLNEGDRLASIRLFVREGDSGKDAPDGYLVLQSQEGYFLRFALSEISKKKKGALGMAGMNLADEDTIKAVYLYGGAHSDGDSIMYKDKELAFGRLKINRRNAKGSKIRR